MAPVGDGSTDGTRNTIETLKYLRIRRAPSRSPVPYFLVKRRRDDDEAAQDGRQLLNPPKRYKLMKPGIEPPSSGPMYEVSHGGGNRLCVVDNLPRIPIHALVEKHLSLQVDADRVMYDYYELDGEAGEGEEETIGAPGMGNREDDEDEDEFSGRRKGYVLFIDDEGSPRIESDDASDEFAVPDEADEDSNAEDFYRNDYPEGDWSGRSNDEGEFSSSS